MHEVRSASGLALKQYLASKASTSAAADIDIIGWYPNYRTYDQKNGSNYQPSEIPKDLNKVIYAFAQVGNCAQDPDTVGAQWTTYNHGQGKITCNKGGYATSEMSGQIYSTDPYTDLLKWSPNDVSTDPKDTNSYRITTAPIPDDWRHTLEYNKNYAVKFQGFLGKGNLNDNNIHDKLYLSIGGWSGSVQLMYAFTKQNPTEQQQSLKDFIDYTSSGLHDSGDIVWGIHSPFNPTSKIPYNPIQGIDIDFEPYSNDWTQMNSDEIKDFISYIKTISDAGVVKDVTVTISGNPNIIPALGRENVLKLASHVDKIQLMTYDYHGAFDSPQITACHTPLFCGKVGDVLNIHSAVKAWTDAGVNPSKLVIGVAAYGRQVANVNVANVDHSLDAKFNDTKGKTPLYNNINQDSVKDTGPAIQERIKSKKLEEKFDLNYGCTYAYDKNAKVFVSYDNKESTKLKMCYAIHKGLGGVMIWDLGGDSTNKLVNTMIKTKNNKDINCIGDFSFDKIDELISQSETCSGNANHDEL